MGDSSVNGQGCPATKWQNCSCPDLRRGVLSAQSSGLRIKLVSASSVFLLEALPGAARTWDELGQASLDALMALLPRDTWSPHLVPAHCSGYGVEGQPVARPSACLLPVVAEAHSSRL